MENKNQKYTHFPALKHLFKFQKTRLTQIYPPLFSLLIKTSIPYIGTIPDSEALKNPKKV
jgi:hypothetical protein